MVKRKTLEQKAEICKLIGQKNSLHSIWQNIRKSSNCARSFIRKWKAKGSILNRKVSGRLKKVTLRVT